MLLAPYKVSICRLDGFKKGRKVMFAISHGEECERVSNAALLWERQY